MINTPEELDGAFPTMEKSRPVVQPSLPIKRTAELALSTEYRPFARGDHISPRWRAGGAYVAAETEMYRRAAALVDKVLKGSRPEERKPPKPLA